MHSTTLRRKYRNLIVHTIPCLSDNYSYIVENLQSNHESIIIDPSETPPILNYLKDHPEINPIAILCTHHHWDHVGGCLELKQKFPKLKVYSGDDRTKGNDQNIRQDTEISFGHKNNLNFKILHTPCHTEGHVCYYNQENGIVFTGDTLFLTGCGRFFEGGPDGGDKMDRNLNSILGNLPEETEIYCGHEYTLAQINFAMAIESSNNDLRIYREACVLLRSQEPPVPTVPGTIGQEKRTNPFMRLDSVEIKQALGLYKLGEGRKQISNGEIMSALREYKNTWRPSK